ncbi:MAG: hypothetical protein IJ060_07950 [Oscillospiraceae bacterium]|nr:hypothetical protein [Oscillospiraceae bacterium]
MKRRKLFCFLFALCMMLVCIPSAPAFAEESAPPEAEDEIVNSVGLISNTWRSISKGTKTIYLTAGTESASTMYRIGLTEMYVQRSANGTSGWSSEKFVGNNIDGNTDSSEIEDFPITVVGGYYYRVYLKHYARATSASNSLIEEIPKYSNVLWVP